MQTVPRVPPLDRPATYDDLVKLPDHVVAEIVNGELHASPRPAPRHAVTGSIIGGRDVLVPDLAGWRRSRMPSLPATAYFPLAPDWVCEILSPSTASLDRAKKMSIYAREKVAHAWLIDPIAGTFEVLRLEGGRWTVIATHTGDEVVRAEPFVEVELDLRSLWAGSTDG